MGGAGVTGGQTVELANRVCRPAFQAHPQVVVESVRGSIHALLHETMWSAMGALLALGQLWLAATESCLEAAVQELQAQSKY